MKALTKCVLVMGTLLAGVVQAAPITLDFSALHTTNSGNLKNCQTATNGSSTTNRMCFSSVSGLNYSISVLANTAGTGTVSNQTLELANMPIWGGYGVGAYNRDRSSSDADASEGSSPEHAIDNNGRNEMLLVTFDEAVDLTHVMAGWSGSDSDISLLAYTGAGGPTFAGQKWGDLAGSGWSQAGNYANLGTNNNRAVNAGRLTSTHWLIGAYNPLTNGSGFDSVSDAFKLKTITFSVPDTDVPEPWTFALFGLGAALLMRRRKV